MATYIQLMTLTPEGRHKTLQDPDAVFRIQQQIQAPEIHLLGLYAVLGQYDLVSFVEAPNNDVVARYSIELGVRAGAHILTMPAVPISRLEAPTHQPPSPELETGVGLTPPRQEEH